MTKRLLAALAVLFVLTGFVTACGDDDDTATAGTEETADDGTDEAADEPADDEAADDDEAAMADDGGAVATFCADFNESDGGDTPIDEVQASLDRAVAAQAEATTQEGSDALQVLIDFTQHVIDNDDGDGVITDAEAQAATPEFPTIEDAISYVTDACSTSRRVRDNAL